MKFEFITCVYRNKKIHILCRDEEGKKRIIKVSDFLPYFYVKESEYIPPNEKIKGLRTGQKTIFGDTVTKIIMETPQDVKSFRDVFEETFESEIPFTRRFIIDVGIKDTFEAPNTDEVSWRDIKCK